MIFLVWLNKPISYFLFPFCDARHTWYWGDKVLKARSSKWAQFCWMRPYFICLYSYLFQQQFLRILRAKCRCISSKYCFNNKAFHILLLHHINVFSPFNEQFSRSCIVHQVLENMSTHQGPAVQIAGTDMLCEVQTDTLTHGQSMRVTDITAEEMMQVDEIEPCISGVGDG